MHAPLLSVENLRTAFTGGVQDIVAVDGMSFTVNAGETVAIVGESGSGKSVTAMSVLRLLNNARLEGQVVFEGRDLLSLHANQMREVRGNKVGMIFQEPMTALNPVMKIGAQIAEAFILREGMKKAEARAQALRLLELVGIPDPKRRLGEYPHQLSGGMRQRVMIAIALASNPALLIADEPTTALDVTIQAQILDLLKDLRKKTGTAVILITHDLGIVAEIADRVVIMYAGRKVEEGPTAQILERPSHPYTKGLVGAVPVPGSAGSGQRKRLTEIAGNVPSPTERPEGCPFAPRCDQSKEICRTVVPEFIQVDCTQRGCACHMVERLELQ